MRGKIYKLLIITAPEIYQKYITVEKKGETVLNIKALNTIYVIMKADILFYKNFVDNVTSIIFKLSPYDPCVTTNLTNVKKYTMVWHVDDIKVSH